MTRHVLFKRPFIFIFEMNPYYSQMWLYLLFKIYFIISHFKSYIDYWFNSFSCYFLSSVFWTINSMASLWCIFHMERNIVKFFLEWLPIQWKWKKIGAIIWKIYNPSLYLSLKKNAIMAAAKTKKKGNFLTELGCWDICMISKM